MIEGKCLGSSNQTHVCSRGFSSGYNAPTTNLDARFMKMRHIKGKQADLTSKHVPHTTASRCGLCLKTVDGNN